MFSATMPSIADNLTNWDDARNWQQDGDEWSHSWGSSAALWHGTILPRIAACLPAGDMLEIACGHGRVTQYLLGHCVRYRGVDLAPSCVSICTQRFAGRSGASFERTDGSTLPGIAAASIDFACSWDSLVHAELDAVGGYVRELGRVLRPGGTAFLHHSTMLDHVDANGQLTVPNPHWRATSVSAAIVQARAIASGLQCVTQELVQWGSTTYSDCFTLLRRQDDTRVAECETHVLRHPAFHEELAHLQRLDRAYRQSLRLQ